METPHNLKKSKRCEKVNKEVLPFLSLPYTENYMNNAGFHFCGVAKLA